MATFKTPGVYVQEISTLPASVAQVATAIPAFIGYTANPVAEPRRIKSMVEFVEVFGGPHKSISVNVTTPGITLTSISAPVTTYIFYYCMQMYFANGGGPCWVVSAGVYGDPVAESDFTSALGLIEREDEPTLLVMPEAVRIATSTPFYNVMKAALAQCNDLQDRFTISDLWDNSTSLTTDADNFRTGIGTSDLKYGAAYYPYLNTSIVRPDESIYFTHTVTTNAIHGKTLAAVIAESQDPASLNAAAFAAFLAANLAAIRTNVEVNKVIVLPPSSAVAGVYARVDATRGVWKAPANESLNAVATPTHKFNDQDQEYLNVTSSGKSINGIRLFKDKGVLIWGARTLAGNDNEWRYVPVRRLFIMVEESISQATEAVVFEPNDANTWVRVKGMIESFLTNLWRQGALAGAKTSDAYFVKVGLGETMTAQDILDGNLIVEVGIAAVRPAEFIILKFSHKLQVS